jgi:hypothetical protein
LLTTTAKAIADGDILPFAQAAIKCRCRFSLRAALPFRAERFTNWYVLSRDTRPD